MKPFTNYKNILAFCAFTIFSAIAMANPSFELGGSTSTDKFGNKDLNANKTMGAIKKAVNKNSNTACQDHGVWGLPTNQNTNLNLNKGARVLCQSGYTSYYDTKIKSPLWVAQIITSSKKDLIINKFFAHDPKVDKNLQSNIDDYAGSGFDMGQLAPFKDMQNEEQMQESFYATNTVPIVGKNMGRDVWAELEVVARGVAESDGMAVVFTGPIFRGKIQTMGAGQIPIPSDFFKIIYSPQSGQVRSYILHNVQIITSSFTGLDAGNSKYSQTLAKNYMRCNSGCELEDFRFKLKEVEELTGFKFLPNLINKQ